MFKVNKNNQQSAGFVILYAVVVASVVSLGGVLLSNIIVKQLILSSIGRESQFAYYAANIGDECARQGIAKEGFGEWGQVGFGGPFEFIDGSNELLCLSDKINNDDIKEYSNYVVYNFSNTYDNLKYEVTVIIKKDNLEKYVISKGYNTSDPNNPRRVEKVIYRDYTPPSNP